MWFVICEQMNTVNKFVLTVQAVDYARQRFLGREFTGRVLLSMPHARGAAQFCTLWLDALESNVLLPAVGTWVTDISVHAEVRARARAPYTYTSCTCFIWMPSLDFSNRLRLV